MMDIFEHIGNKIGKVSYNNCMTWALFHWFKYGGYLVLRRAKSPLPYPHFMWVPSESCDMYHFVPVKNLKIPWPIFRGFVKKGDWTIDELKMLDAGEIRSRIRDNKVELD